MERTLERIFQNSGGFFSTKEGKYIPSESVYPVSDIKMIVTTRLDSEKDEEIKERVKSGSSFIPKRANTYAFSDFDGATQHIREDLDTGESKMFRVYAVQFYYVLGSWL